MWSTSPATPLPASIYETPDATKESLNLLTLNRRAVQCPGHLRELIYDLVLGFINADTDDDALLGEREVEGSCGSSDVSAIKCRRRQLRS